MKSIKSMLRGYKACSNRQAFNDMQSRKARMSKARKSYKRTKMIKVSGMVPTHYIRVDTR